MHSFWVSTQKNQIIIKIVRVNRHRMTSWNITQHTSELIHLHYESTLYSFQNNNNNNNNNNNDRLCGLVVRVSGYRFRGPGSIPGATRFFLRSSGSGTGSTQPRDDN
jgi:hypothetical protein